MIINKKEKFQEVFPSSGMLLFLDGRVFEGLCCPLDVNPSAIYTEITLKEAAEFIINEENTEDSNDGNNNITTN